MLFAERAERHERSELLRLAKRLDALSARDRSVFAASHEKLHRLIAQFARCPALSEEINKLYAAAATWLCATPPLSQRNSKSAHQDLIKVLVNGSPAAAGKAMRKHVRHTKECAPFGLEVFFRFQKQYPHEYPRNGNKALCLNLLLSGSESVGSIRV